MALGSQHRKILWNITRVLNKTRKGNWNWNWNWKQLKWIWWGIDHIWNWEVLECSDIWLQTERLFRWCKSSESSKKARNVKPEIQESPSVLQRKAFFSPIKHLLLPTRSQRTLQSHRSTYWSWPGTKQPKKGENVLTVFLDTLSLITWPVSQTSLELFRYGRIGQGRHVVRGPPYFADGAPAHSRGEGTAGDWVLIEGH